VYIKAQTSQPIVQAGLTGLFMASMNGHLDVVRLLLESKADANLADQVPVLAPFPKQLISFVQDVNPFILTVPHCIIRA
jgi:ankyrin repeat protein